MLTCSASSLLSCHRPSPQSKRKSTLSDIASKMGAPKSATPTTSIPASRPTSAHSPTFPPTPSHVVMKGSNGAARAIRSSSSNNKEDVPQVVVDTSARTGSVTSSDESDLFILVDSPSSPSTATQPTTRHSKGTSDTLRVCVPWKAIISETIKHSSLVDTVLLHLAAVPAGKERAFKILGAGSAVPARKYSDLSNDGQAVGMQSYNLPSPTSIPGSGQTMQLFTPPEQAGLQWEHGYSNVSSTSTS